MIAELQVPLRGEEAAALSARHHGEAAQALLYQCLELADPTACQHWHAANGDKPFTTALLRTGVGPAAPCLRFTTLTRDVHDTLCDGLGARLRTNPEFRVSGVSLRMVAPTDLDAVSTPYGDLLRAEPCQRVRLHFLTPTTFQRQGRSLPLPDPVLICDSLVRRWNAFAPVPVCEDVAGRLRETLVVAAAEVSVGTVRLTRTKRVGFTGRVKLELWDPTEELSHWLGALSAFAPYSGIGAGTGIGLGQVRLAGAEEHGGRVKEGCECLTRSN